MPHRDYCNLEKWFKGEKGGRPSLASTRKPPTGEVTTGLGWGVPAGLTANKKADTEGGGPWETRGNVAGKKQTKLVQAKR